MKIYLGFCPKVKDLVEALRKIPDQEAPILIESDNGGSTVQSVEFVFDVPFKPEFAKTVERKSTNIVLLSSRKPINKGE